MDSARISRLKMHRDRVMDGRSNTELGQRTLHRVPVRHTNHVLVENGHTIGSSLRARDARFLKGTVIGVGDLFSTQVI